MILKKFPPLEWYSNNEAHDHYGRIPCTTKEGKQKNKEEDVSGASPIKGMGQTKINLASVVSVLLKRKSTHH